MALYKMIYMDNENTISLMCTFTMANTKLQLE